MAKKNFTRDDFSPLDLIHAALDHLTAAEELFKTSPAHFDSAGYILHIGMELVLKAWLLETVGHFTDTHDLGRLYLTIESEGGVAAIDKRQTALLKMVDGYGFLRYPNLVDPIEIGTENWPETKSFVDWLLAQLPETLARQMRDVDHTVKGGRVLTKIQIKAL